MGIFDIFKKDFSQNINLIDNIENDTLDELYKGSALTFVGVLPTNKNLNFIYRWLRNGKWLKEENIDIYLINRKKCKREV